MSYDLYLLPKIFDADEIRAYFASRPHYEVGETQALYSNPDTGVYFSFEFFEKPDEGDEQVASVQGRQHVAFNLNYCRPHIFGLEAEPEVRAFVEAFACEVEDPQTEGMAGPAYSRERFLSGWSHGNRFGFKAITNRNSERPLTADAAQIEAVWAWNYGRAQLQAEAVEKQFVPKVVWLQPEPGAAPVRCVTWTFGVATVIPETLITHIVLVRQQRPSALKMFSRQSGDEKFEFKLLDVSGGIRLRGVESGEVDGKTVLFTPATGPLEVQALFSGKWPKPAFSLLAPEAVFGDDLARESQ